MFPEAHILQPLINIFNDVLVWLHDNGLSWGIGIVLITWLSRLVVLPFTLKSMHGMREMQALQPYIKELQEKYKDDKQRMQREQMALFQEHGVNPLSACLPLVFQFPVFIALYALLRSSEFKDEVGNTGWLFVSDLTTHPTGAEAAVLIVLSVLSTFALLFFNPSPTTGGASQRYLMAGIFSLVTVFLIPQCPRRNRRLLHRQRGLADGAAGRDPPGLAAAFGADAGGGPSDQAAAATSAQAETTQVATRPLASGA